jgi:membrane protein DedA with SNARE-associated domain
LELALKWLAEYGYWAVLGGTLLEGEVVLLLAGFAAQQGVLYLPAVIAVAFCGGVIGDEGFYFLGRSYGSALLSRWPSLQAPAARVTSLLQLHHSWVIVGVRFAYGLRIAGPIVIGASGIPILRFLSFNMIGAAIWAPLVAGAGYLFGESIAWLVPRLGAFEAVGLVVIATIAAGVAWMKARRR